MKEVRIRLVTRTPLVEYEIRSPADAIVMMQTVIGDLADEYMAAVYLDNRLKAMDFLIAGIGNTRSSVMDPGTIMKGALLQNASSIMLFHNHPSGYAEPSARDIAATQKAALAAKLLGLDLVDHVIVTDDSYYSFAEEGQIELTEDSYLKSLREMKQLSTEEFNKRYSFRLDAPYYQNTEEDHGIKIE